MLIRFCSNLRSGLADPSVIATGDPSHLDGQAQHGAGDPAGDHGTGGGHEGIHVFTADFSRVEIPFIISLWIFCASLAKIGE